VAQIIDGSPAAAKDGLKVGDRILAISPHGDKSEESFVYTLSLPHSEFRKLLQGEEGSHLRLRISRKDVKVSPLEVELERVRLDHVSVPWKPKASESTDEFDHRISVSVRKVPGKTGEHKLGVIAFQSFYDSGDKVSVSSDIRKALTRLEDEGIDGLLLDLSQNDGGVTTEASKVAGLFLEKGNLNGDLFPDGSFKIFTDLDPHIYYRGPLAILTSRETKSSAEQLTSILKDYGRALIIGDDRTYGKGTGWLAEEIHIEKDGGLFSSSEVYRAVAGVTTMMYFSPSGKTPQFDGIIPDILVPGQFKDALTEKNSSRYPIPNLGPGEPFLSSDEEIGAGRSWRKITPDLIAKLKARHESREKAPKTGEKPEEHQLNAALAILSDWASESP
jgi:carboxyl-terminal processing protease